MECNERPVAMALTTHLHIVIQQYCNTLHLAEVPEECDYGRSSEDKSIKHSSTAFGPKGGAFDKKKGIKKMQTTFGHENDQLDTSTHSAYLILPEYKREKLYSELLTKIMTFETNLRLMIGPWREHAGFLERFANQIKLFHLPEIHDLFAPTLFNLI
jgi:hypothetical protein